MKSSGWLSRFTRFFRKRGFDLYDRIPEYSPFGIMASHLTSMIHRMKKDNSTYKGSETEFKLIFSKVEGIAERPEGGGRQAKGTRASAKGWFHSVLSFVQEERERISQFLTISNELPTTRQKRSIAATGFDCPNAVATEAKTTYWTACPTSRPSESWGSTWRASSATCEKTQHHKDGRRFFGR